MAAQRKTTRRQFLRGRAAVEALQDLAAGDGLAPLPEPATVAATSSAAPGYLMQISRRAMATDFEILLPAVQHGRATEAALQALDLVEELENQLTVYRPGSEVMAINGRAADGPVAVEGRLFALLQLALTLSRETVGAFDITAGPLSQVWGFSRRAGQLPAAEALAQAMSRVGYRHLELDDERHTIRFLRRGVEINLNALGKGYGVDRCAELLRAAGVANFLIHGGQSSVLAGGAPADSDDDVRGWSVALRHPLKPQVRLAEIWLCDRALGTSGSGVQFFHHQGRRYGHVLDPRTGWPAEGILSATVLAPSAALADALSTACFVMGRQGVEEYCRNHPEVSAILVCPGQRSGSLDIGAYGMPPDDWRRLDLPAGPAPHQVEPPKPAPSGP
ncbi:MAG: FAD:protein FMN transferase [Candidatus Anammoximicrobium sp.]|mgnify:CR=1 FL=1|nr:FAD:protein FMN transferase [Candidatus Anammoximicrobium sp.]